MRQPYDTPEIPASERLEWPPRKLRSHCWVFQRCLSLWFRLVWESGPILQGSVQASFWILLSHPFSVPMACFHPPPPPFLLFLSLSPCLSQTLTSAQAETRIQVPPTQKRLGRKRGSGPEMVMDSVVVWKAHLLSHRCPFLSPAVLSGVGLSIDVRTLFLFGVVHATRLGFQVSLS